MQGAAQLQPYDYSAALSAGMQFYQAQRSGNLTRNLIPWRGSSGLSDLPTGGYYLGTSARLSCPAPATPVNPCTDIVHVQE